MKDKVERSPEEVATVIRTWIVGSGMNLRKTAEAIGVSPWTFYGWLAAEPKTRIPFVNARDICTLFGTSLDVLAYKQDDDEELMKAGYRR